MSKKVKTDEFAPLSYWQRINYAKRIATGEWSKDMSKASRKRFVRTCIAAAGKAIAEHHAEGRYMEKHFRQSIKDLFQTLPELKEKP